LRVDELPVPEAVKEVLHRSGIVELYPPQEKAFGMGVLEGRNLVMVTPTASGKTLVAEVCALKHVLELGGKVVYLTPLRALASEKYETFLKYAGLEKPGGGRVKVAISTGDYDSSDPWLEAYDIIVLTNEKMDSLLRHGARWIDDITLVVADEVHLIGTDRGPTLEVVLARLRQVRPDVQIIALSATVSNAEDIADWLDAELVKSEWRPVELKEGVYLRGRVVFRDGSTWELRKAHRRPEVNIALNTVSEGGQALIFVESRRRAESMAREVSRPLSAMLTEEDRAALEEVAREVLEASERTRLSEELASLISRGAAFHHAGLGGAHRKIVEDRFREGLIKVLTATPTLAAGVNLPARVVVVSSYRRYEPGYGMYPISVLEYKQMAGRGGRPQYDEIGYAILLAKTEDEMDFLMERYILGRPERIYSRLASEAALRSHILSVVASEFAHTLQGILDFFGRTFYAYYYDVKPLGALIDAVVRFLWREDLVKIEGDYISATRFGRRVSELYIDPLSAVIIRDCLQRGAEELTDLSLLHLVCHTPDMSPKFRPDRGEYEDLLFFVEEHRGEFMTDVPSEIMNRIAFEEFLSEVKTAMVLKAWVEEASENDLLEKFGVQPGDRYRATSNAEWLLYAVGELAKVLGFKQYVPLADRLRLRVKHGIREELIPLASIKGVGRVRARLLYRAGYKTLTDLKRASLRDLIRVPSIGPRLALAIKEQVGGLVSKEELEEFRRMAEKFEQSSLSDYSED